MPVSRAMMTTSERTTSIRTSDTRDQRLLAHDLAQVWVLVDDAFAQRLQAVAAWNGHAEPDADLGGDATVGSRLRGWGRAALLVLNATFQVDQAGLALVRMAHRQHDVDVGEVWHRARGRQHHARERPHVQLGPILVADRQNGL